MYPISLDKKNGRSLELLDFESPCLQGGNWSVSDDESGGTPGRKNSRRIRKLILVLISMDFFLNNKWKSAEKLSFISSS